MSSSERRQIFVDTPVVRSRPQKAHTHGIAAAGRNAGSATCELVAEMLGLEPYFVQSSLSDLRKRRKGCRSFHWAKDLPVSSAAFTFEASREAVCMVDVDFHIDMPTMLAQYPGVYLMHTFQPTVAAESTGEYSFRFEADNRVRYEVSGGAEYLHEVYDYSGDTFLVENVGFLTKSVISYHIDRKTIDANHCVIMLSPLAKFDMPSVIPTAWVIEGKRLDRLRPVHGEHVVLDVIRGDGRSRSVAMLGDRLAVTLPTTQWDAINAVARVAKVPVTPSMVAGNIAPSDAVGLPTERLPPGHAAIIASYTRAGVPQYPAKVYAPMESCVPIWFSKHDYDAPVPLAGFGSPLIGPCYSYAKSLASEAQCIQGRVEAFQGQSDAPILPSSLGFIREFLEFLIPVPHVGHPVDHDRVREKQAKPSQKAILEEASLASSRVKSKVGAFVKIEPAVKPSDPRNISTVEPVVKLEYSTYSYSFHEGVMANQAWYAFNKNPSECAARVAEKCLLALYHAVNGDGSRFDGHVNLLARILERMAMLRYFCLCYHADMNRSMDDQIALPGKTTEGYRYNSGYSRLSGSLETADFNSLDTAFIDYCALRNTLKNGRKLTPQEAWNGLTIYGGDDSLSIDVDPKALLFSAKLMGQNYELEVVKRGDIGVEFLNRRFGPDVWNGDVNSMANPSRLLSKLWVGPTSLKRPLLRFAERLGGYYRMDRNSPVIGQICDLSHALLGEVSEEGVLVPWDGKHSLENNWPNVDTDGWMYTVFEKSIPDFDWDRFQAWITEVWSTRGQDPWAYSETGEGRHPLLKAPLCTSAPTEVITVKVPSVVGDELVLPKPKADVPKGSEEKPEAGPEPSQAVADQGPLPKGKEELDGTLPHVEEAKLVVKKSDPMQMGYRDTELTAEEKAAERARRTPSPVRRFGDDDVSPLSPVMSRKALPQKADLSSPNSFSDEVAAASAAVPRAGPDGKRLKNPAAKDKKQDGNTSREGAKSTHTDPREWIAPKQKEGESAKEYQERISKWSKTRARVAKRQGVKLDSAKESGV